MQGLRFVLEIIRDIKRKAGADFPVLVNFNMDDYVQGGIVP